MGVADTIWIMAFAGGVIAFLSPCFFPLVPVYLSYLVGVEHTGRWRTLAHSAVFTIGFASIFALYGAGVGLLGDLLRPKLDAIRVLSGVAMVLFGILLLGLHNYIPLLARLFRMREISLKPQHRIKPTIMSSAAIGVIFAFAWVPCISPILGSILTLALSFGDWQRSTVLLALYSAGLGIPFIGSALLVDVFRSGIEVRDKSPWPLRHLLSLTLLIGRPIKRFAHLLQKFSALAMIAFGILMLTDKFQLLFSFGL